MARRNGRCLSKIALQLSHRYRIARFERNSASATVSGAWVRRVPKARATFQNLAE
jgi:hypothetical protein